MELAVRMDAATEMEAGRGEACEVGGDSQRGSTPHARQGTWATGGDEAASAAKPTMSYIALIATAILSSPAQRLNLASIYMDIQGRFPYFRTSGQGWKNSVRHNLSLNDCFVKLGRCEDGKGSYWGIHPAHHANFLRGDFRQHRKAGRGRLQRALRVATTRTVWRTLSPVLPHYGTATTSFPTPSVGGLYCEHPDCKLLAWGLLQPSLAGLGQPCYSLYMRPPLTDWQFPWPASTDIIFPGTWLTEPPRCY